nr:MAG TPA: hypothetical protein [Caudoviricetes sp.]
MPILSIINYFNHNSLFFSKFRYVGSLYITLVNNNLVKKQ